MKKRIYNMVLAVMAACAFVACSDDDKPAENFGVTTFPTQSVAFEGMAAGQTAQVSFTAGADWTATFANTNDWLQIAPTRGKAGEATITVTALTDNRRASQRSAQLWVLVDGSDQPYVVTVTQASAAESDIRLSGDVDNDVMTLEANSNGKFTGTLVVESTSLWTIKTNTTSSGWLTFQQEGQPQDGKATTVRLVVSADYSNFTQDEMTGTFDLEVPGAVPVTVTVKAKATTKVYQNETAQEGEAECNTFELDDSQSAGMFQATFYVESNIFWQVQEVPEWLEIAGGTATNRKDDGTLLARRVGVGVLLKADYLSVFAREGDVELKDAAGKTVATVHVSFKGISNNYLEHDFAFPAEFAFEANESYFDPNEPKDHGKAIELPFHIMTSIDYADLSQAPYHLVMAKAYNGRIQKQEVHWATLRMGDASKNTAANGIYTKEIYLKSNNRGDADDTDGLTNPAQPRSAFIFLVPRSVSFDDLFDEGTSSLKPEYAEAFSYIDQKQDHNADYVLELDGLANGQTLDFGAEGGAQTFGIKKASTGLLSYTLRRLWYNTATEQWEERVPTTAQSNSIYIDYETVSGSDVPSSLIVVMGANTTSAERRFRFYINAFRGDGYDDKQVLTFDLVQQPKQ